MAERKSGPVKPPVIDLKARDASEAKPAEEAAALAVTPAPAAKPRTAPKASAKSTDAAAPVAPAAEEPAATAEPMATPKASAAPEEPKPAPRPEPDAKPEPPKPQPAAQTAAAPQPASQLPPRPAPRLAMPWSAISIAAVAGAILGAGLTYLAANWIALPNRGPRFNDPAPALAALSEAAQAIEERVAAAETSTADVGSRIDATAAQLAEAVTNLQRSIADVRAAIPDQQETIDLSAIEAELQRLNNRIEAVAAGASSADAAALAESLLAIEGTLDTLNTRVGALDTRLGDDDRAMTEVRAEIEALKAAIAAQNLTLGGAEIGPAVKLPLILSGLESALSRGRPYEVELESLLALLPDLSVPQAVADNAATGLIRPDALADRFDAAVPDILAGRTGESTGDWARDAVEWAAALLALRPADEIEGDTPEAIVSRLEGAVDRHDFTAAAVLLAQLPDTMRLAAGEIGEAIAAHADAEGFITALRAQALAPALEGTN